MYKKLLQNKTEKGIEQKTSDFLLHQSAHYLKTLEKELDDLLDSRLVRTFFNLFVAILTFRNRSNGLLLSELGGYICGFSKAPAGTKRISNLLRSKKWQSKIIDDFFFERTKRRLAELKSQGKRALFLWDDSRIEKPESWFIEGLCSVYSSKGKRLTKIKRGYYNPPSSRICVPGFKWTGILLSNLGGIPSVCQMTWWTTRGKHKEVGTNIIYRLLKKLKAEVEDKVLHVLDRGYANSTMIEWMIDFNQDFLIRWKKRHLLVHQEKGTKKTYLLAKSFRGKSQQIVWDKERKVAKKVTIAWAEVTHPDFPDKQLYLVIVRDKHNYNSPMYLLTSIKVNTKRLAWEMCFSYMHRWEIEQAFRCCKAELGMESPRLWFWENRLKLLAIVALVYDFLLRMIRNWKAWTKQVMRNWCHRTGNRYHNATIPIYRLRAAISNALLALFYANLSQNSG